MRATYRSADIPPPDAFLTSTDDFLGAYSSIEEIDPIPFMTKEEEDYLVEQYSIQGFKNSKYSHRLNPSYHKLIHHLPALQFYTRTVRILDFRARSALI